MKRYWKNVWDDIWWEYHHNGIWGPGGYSTRKFKTANLAVVIASLTLLLIVILFITLI